jgi:hypothetical protein
MSNRQNKYIWTGRKSVVNFSQSESQEESMTRYSTEEKTARLEQWKASGKSTWEYARENGIKGQTFSKWVKKQEGSGKRFVELRAAGIACGPGGIVVEKGAIKVHLPFGMSGKEIRTVMEGTGFLP